MVIESDATVREVSDGSERVRLRFDRGAGMFTVGCDDLFDVLTKAARSLFLEVPLHGRRARVTGFEAS